MFEKSGALVHVAHAATLRHGWSLLVFFDLGCRGFRRQQGPFLHFCVKPMILRLKLEILDFELPGIPDFDRVRGAGDARIIVPYCMLAKCRKLLFRQIRIPGGELPQIFFDAFLILRGWRHYPDVEKVALVVDAVAVI